MLAAAGDAAQGVPPDVAGTLKTLFIVIQALGLVARIIIFIFYLITRTKSEETRRILNQRNQYA